MQVKQPNKILTTTKKQRQEPKVGKKTRQEEENGELENSKGKFNQMQRNSVRNCLRV